MSDLRDKALEKLDKELASIVDDAKKKFAQPCIEFLRKRCGEDDSICEDILQEHKTWEKCSKYVNDQARKELGGSSGPVWHETVYEWVEDYFHLDDKALEEKKAKEEAERKKRQAENAKRAKEKAAKNSKAGKRPAAVKEKKAESEKPVQKKKANEIDGQMDIFSMGL